MKHFLLLHYIKLQAFLRKEDGASAIEYAIIAGLIAVGIIGAATALGTDVSDLFGKISTAFEKVSLPED